jgi:hypothetical protein
VFSAVHRQPIGKSITIGDAIAYSISNTISNAFSDAEPNANGITSAKSNTTQL